MTNLSPEETGKRYDQIATDYEKNRSSTIGMEYLEKFLLLLDPKESGQRKVSILDIGCGTGLPLMKRMVDFGANVTGIDISSEMIQKAKANVPGASIIEGDILTFAFEETFDGILAWDSLFHLPLGHQEQAIRNIASLLKPNGIFLFTAGGSEGELRSTMFNTEFYYSSLSSQKYESILTDEHCSVLLNEVDDPRSRGHRVICCRNKRTDDRK
ncbi:MAG: trans-aconitate 2-methyltransferase [Erysipelotrichaceae bacterium]